mmetsp:Transcript_22178/g.61537  ORF Transcript_22178/g.61537 Transcript_22178/m.61537 type:complete len:215 (+) Transcript_22178:83-727(+)
MAMALDLFLYVCVCVREERERVGGGAAAQGVLVLGRPPCWGGREALGEEIMGRGEIASWLHRRVREPQNSLSDEASSSSSRSDSSSSSSRMRLPPRPSLSPPIDTCVEPSLSEPLRDWPSTESSSPPPAMFPLTLPPAMPPCPSDRRIVPPWFWMGRLAISPSSSDSVSESSSSRPFSSTSCSPLRIRSSSSLSRFCIFFRCLSFSSAFSCSAL